MRNKIIVIFSEDISYVSAPFFDSAQKSSHICGCFFIQFYFTVPVPRGEAGVPHGPEFILPYVYTCDVAEAGVVDCGAVFSDDVFYLEVPHREAVVPHLHVKKIVV